MTALKRAMRGAIKSLIWNDASARLARLVTVVNSSFNGEGDATKTPKLNTFTNSFRGIEVTISKLRAVFAFNLNVPAFVVKVVRSFKCERGAEKALSRRNMSALLFGMFSLFLLASVPFGSKAQVIVPVPDLVVRDVETSTVTVGRTGFADVSHLRGTALAADIERAVKLSPSLTVDLSQLQATIGADVLAEGVAFSSEGVDVPVSNRIVTARAADIKRAVKLSPSVTVDLSQLIATIGADVLAEGVGFSSEVINVPVSNRIVTALASNVERAVKLSPSLTVDLSQLTATIGADVLAEGVGFSSEVINVPVSSGELTLPAGTVLTGADGQTITLTSAHGVTFPVGAVVIVPYTPNENILTMTPVVTNFGRLGSTTMEQPLVRGNVLSVEDLSLSLGELGVDAVPYTPNENILALVPVTAKLGRFGLTTMEHPLVRGNVLSVEDLSLSLGELGVDAVRYTPDISIFTLVPVTAKLGRFGLTTMEYPLVRGNVLSVEDLSLSLIELGVGFVPYIYSTVEVSQRSRVRSFPVPDVVIPRYLQGINLEIPTDSTETVFVFPDEMSLSEALGQSFVITVTVFSEGDGVSSPDPVIPPDGVDPGDSGDTVTDDGTVDTGIDSSIAIATFTVFPEQACYFPWNACIGIGINRVPIWPTASMVDSSRNYVADDARQRLIGLSENTRTTVVVALDLPDGLGECLGSPAVLPSFDGRYDVDLNPAECSDVHVFVQHQNISETLDIAIEPTGNCVNDSRFCVTTYGTTRNSAIQSVADDIRILAEAQSNTLTPKLLWNISSILYLSVNSRTASASLDDRHTFFRNGSVRPWRDIYQSVVKETPDNNPTVAFATLYAWHTSVTLSTNDRDGDTGPGDSGNAGTGDDPGTGDSGDTGTGDDPGTEDSSKNGLTLGRVITDSPGSATLATFTVFPEQACYFPWNACIGRNPIGPTASMVDSSRDYVTDDARQRLIGLSENTRTTVVVALDLPDGLGECLGSPAVLPSFDGRYDVDLNPAECSDVHVFVQHQNISETLDIAIEPTGNCVNDSRFCVTTYGTTRNSAIQSVADDIRMFFEAQTPRVPWNMIALIFIAANPSDQTSVAGLRNNSHLVNSNGTIKSWQEAYRSLLGTNPNANTETAFELLRDRYFSKTL